ncbi:MFS transporter [Nocardiopsis ganjiahuensis]|uniref:MFS transporter n=1 Tax=Nocardiopsis ganjiahuensis TaxID=239984 RepID=UPI00037E413D|nr:MFS transporter [Nocardiopsis ganjiahuensis]
MVDNEDPGSGTPRDGTTTTPGPLGGGYWRLWTSSGLSNLADGVLKVALPLLALRFTDSPLLIGGVGVALSLPWLLFALPAGALADRLDRRRAMLGANTVRGTLALALLLGVGLDLGSIGLIYAAAFLLGTAETLYDTTAQSILPQLVRRDQLSRANGRLYGMEMAANELIGPPLGSTLVAVGLALALFTPGALWLAAVGALLLVRGRFGVSRTGPRTSMRADIAEGVRYLWSHRVLRTFAVLAGVSNFALSAVFTLLVVYAVGPDSPLGLTEAAFGLLFSTFAAGSLVGAFVAERCERMLGRARALRLSVVPFALLALVPGLTADAWLVGLGFVVGGIGVMVWNVITVSLRQRMAPGALLGRVNSVYRLLAWGTRPLGAGVGGLLAQFLGTQAMFVVMGLLILTLTVPLLRIDDAALDAAESSGTPSSPKAA